MRKVILFMVTSLDGFVCGVNNELDWENLDPAVSRDLIPELLATTDTMILGRNLYDGFKNTWPKMAENAALPKDLVSFANWVIDSPKIVFSHTPEEVTWKNSILVHAASDDDIVKEVARLKSLPGGDMVLFGGAQMAQTLVRLGLVDEYRFKLQAIALGAGKPLFADPAKRTTLELIKGKVYDSGVVALYYKPKA